MDLEALLLVKIVVTVLAVLSLSVVAENLGPRLAGVLAGYPMGSAIALGFYGVEFGAEFAGRCATYNLAGLLASLFFVALYYGVSLRPRRFSAAIASCVAFAGYLVAAWLLERFQLHGWPAVAAVGAAILGFSRGLHEREERPLSPRVRYTPALLLLRALLAAAMVVAVTGVAGWVGPRWAGLLSAFPVTLYPLLLVMHLSYGPVQAQAVIRHFPAGLWSVVAYSLTVASAYPVLGVFFGTLLGFAAATAVLVLRFWGPVLLSRRRPAGSELS